MNAILLIQVIEKHADVAFDYPLEKYLKALSPTAFYSCDSLSDQVVVHYLKSMLKEDGGVIFIFDCRRKGDIGVGRTLLNACIRKQGAELICLGESKQLTPFLQLMSGSVFKSETELMDYLNSN